jgi:hypothetical protein
LYRAGKLKRVLALDENDQNAMEEEGMVRNAFLLSTDHSILNLASTTGIASRPEFPVSWQLTV